MGAGARRAATMSAEELWRRFELAESDGALDGGAHRKGRLKLRAARPSADAAAQAKSARTRTSSSPRR